MPKQNLNIMKKLFVLAFCLTFSACLSSVLGRVDAETGVVACLSSKVICYPVVINNPDGYVVVTGEIRDRETRKKIPEVSISVSGTDISTVSNADGTFILKIPQHLLTKGIIFSHIGYQRRHVTVEDVTNTHYIYMQQAAKLLDEVVVRGDARALVEEALEKIPKNYSVHDNLFTAFYRETVQKRKRYIGVSEAVVEAYKTSYSGSLINRDKVKLIKSRRRLSQRSGDTLAVKIVGGPNLIAVADFVKDRDEMLETSHLDYYRFRLENSTMLDGNLQYVISFSPQVKLSYALFSGLLYIDARTLAFTRAEMSLDMSDRNKATEMILYKKPFGLHFKPLELKFLITYRQLDGKTYFNYFCNTIRFKCDWKKKLFSADYTVRSEAVMTDRNANPVERIMHNEAFGTNQIFYDIAIGPWNDDYWEGYNVIAPTESLEDAVEKLSKIKH